MTKMLEQRIARIELKMSGSGPPALSPELRFNPLMNPDGFVVRCLVLPERVLQGMEEFYRFRQWRDRATCPDAGTCEHAGYCKAGDESYESAQ
ncbi:MAG: hypothetical protein HY941_07170 [Gammaproteobacteria bacterium]|nr:hypothetical protein [Gammaproteobacteria bacterium]